jgi:K+-sensing histidine kinase KdpD
MSREQNIHSIRASLRLAKHLALALDNITQLKDMVSDLLDITRVATHKLTLAHQPTSLVKVISEVGSVLM